MSQNLLSAAVVIGALKVNFSVEILFRLKISAKRFGSISDPNVYKGYQQTGVYKDCMQTV